MDAYRSPKGHAIIGTYEYIPGTASISGIHPDGTPEHDGERTQMHWDDSRQVIRDGQGVFVCEDGELWKFGQLVKVETVEGADAGD